MTTFDRYLLGRFWHVFGIGYFATVGLFVVFDGFTNIDAFQDRAGGASGLVVLARMAEFYAYQSLVMFEMVGPILTVIATMVVFALLLKNRELHPILSAGVPAVRLVVPMLIGTMVVNGLLMFNQEVLLPAVADELLKPMGASAQDTQRVYVRRDFSSQVEISGEGLILTQHKLLKPEFLLPAPEINSEITTLRAEHAIYQRKTKQRPAGWHLTQATPDFDDLRLTSAGQKVVLPLTEPGHLFVVTDVGSEQLSGMVSAYRYQSSWELVERLRNPSFSTITARSQVLHLHERMTRPLGNLLAVCLAVPMVLRRESFSIITNLAVCCGMMLVLMALVQTCNYLGRIHWLSLDFAIWLPIIVCGGLVAWLSDQMQT
ncbi:MAG: LptF/LptG family permease [Planctomycetaceae bacterium]